MLTDYKNSVLNCLETQKFQIRGSSKQTFIFLLNLESILFHIPNHSCLLTCEILQYVNWCIAYIPKKIWIIKIWISHALVLFSNPFAFLENSLRMQDVFELKRSHLNDLYVISILLKCKKILFELFENVRQLRWRRSYLNNLNIVWTFLRCR